MKNHLDPTDPERPPSLMSLSSELSVTVCHENASVVMVEAATAGRESRDLRTDEQLVSQPIFVWLICVGELKRQPGVEPVGEGNDSTSLWEWSQTGRLRGSDGSISVSSHTFR